MLNAAEYAFELGYEAYGQGKPQDANPFSRAINREDWLDGWLIAQDLEREHNDSEQLQWV